MRIRTFNAATMAEAMALVRDTLGDDAIIVSTRQGRRGRGVEVRAAVEPAPDPSAARAVAATLDDTAAIDRLLRERLRSELAGTPAQAAESLPRPAADNESDLKAVGEALVFHRVPSALGKALLSDARRFETTSGRDALAAALETRFAFSPLPDVPARPTLLVGPPGVGKTATAAKLAARSLLSGGPVRMITTDTIKAGGLAQMEAFARMLDLPCETADAPDELSTLLERGGRSPVIIDTPGTNPFNRAEREDLIAFMRGCDVEPVLVLAAGGDMGDMVDTARIFQEMGARRAIITRLDVARRLGSVLWLMQATGLAYAQASQTPYLADGLLTLDAPGLARRLMSKAAPQPGRANAPVRTAPKEISSR